MSQNSASPSEPRDFVVDSLGFSFIGGIPPRRDLALSIERDRGWVVSPDDQACIEIRLYPEGEPMPPESRFMLHDSWELTGSTRFGDDGIVVHRSGLSRHGTTFGGIDTVFRNGQLHSIRQTFQSESLHSALFPHRPHDGLWVQAWHALDLVSGQTRFQVAQVTTEPGWAWIKFAGSPTSIALPFPVVEKREFSGQDRWTMRFHAAEDEMGRYYDCTLVKPTAGALGTIRLYEPTPGAHPEFVQQWNFDSARSLLKTLVH